MRKNKSILPILSERHPSVAGSTWILSTLPLDHTNLERGLLFVQTQADRRTLTVEVKCGTI